MPQFQSRSYRPFVVLVFLVFLLLGRPPMSKLSAQEPEAPRTWAIALHGGAGIDVSKLAPEDRQAVEAALLRALRTGRTILAEGGVALDAVEATIRVLEDEPLFNAGRGSVFNSEGRHELDASIMDGETKACGAVGGVRTIRNPISLARLVMTETRHVLLIGDGAEQFADEMRDRPQIERVENAWFSTSARREAWLRARQREQADQAPPGEGAPPTERGRGTVGCVCLDRQGRLAAGTSTGGVTNKRWGRVGDSPIIGAGTYADSATCAVSCTGIGEHFIRHAAAYQVSARMALGNATLDEAARAVIDDVLPPDSGGLIAVGRDGTIVMKMNTVGMSRAACDSTGREVVQLARD